MKTDQLDIQIDQPGMQKYLNDFEVFKHKFLHALPEGTNVNYAAWDAIVKCFYPKGQECWDMEQAVNTFLTMDKVYHYGNELSAENNNLLEQVTEKFLRQYVNIDGIEELFQSSYFYFEWMMHLEYKEQQHDYSYYRDHYMHQIRNLYEMFVLLEKEEMWRLCMNTYKSRNDRVADAIKDSVQKQKSQMSPDMKQLFGNLTVNFMERYFEECCYHYIIFGTAIVSSLIHDIGYPIVFMKRNLDRIQGFLPISYIFMDVKNSMPNIKSLLGSSLLFATVGMEEIQKRLNSNDHGAYSAVILLYQYYDNGQIFSLDPIKRMVIELSALVIYNHTLRYAFQDRKKFDRYHNVFVDNPLSYLFRLCDDLQEWERVYFLISEKSAFFICDKCKTPMLRLANKKHIPDNANEQKIFSYTCFCGNKGWNSLWFPYRRMINVAPFTHLAVSSRTLGKWTVDLVCDKKALLQLAYYNDTFAIQRLRGIRELRAMVKDQQELPDIRIRAFVSNNPVAIKSKILEEFIKKHIGSKYFYYASSLQDYLQYESDDFLSNPSVGMQRLKEYAMSHATGIYLTLINKINKKHPELFGRKRNRKAATLLETSIQFYLFMVLLGYAACRKELKFSLSDQEDYERDLSSYCTKLAVMASDLWNITNSAMIALMTDCFILMHCDINSEEFFRTEKTFRYQVTYPLRSDICDIVESYIDERDYLYICRNGNRVGRLRENIFDFYSDYFLFFVMDMCT